MTKHAKQPVIRRNQDSHPILTAHQGIQGKYPPNSLAAISASFGVAEAVEFDVHIAKRSGQEPELVVIHPEGYKHFVNLKGMSGATNIPEETFEELRAVTARGVQVVPTLDEVIQTYIEKRNRLAPTELQIELKGQETTEPVIKKLLDYVDRRVLSFDDFVVFSFCYPGEDPSRLEIARSLSPEMRLGLTIRGGDFSQDLFDNLDQVLSFCKQHKLTHLDISRRNLTPEIVKTCKAQGLHQSCHHARTADEIQHAVSLGVDSIRADYFLGSQISDYPPTAELSNELYNSLLTTGFYRLTGWIWELAWDLQTKDLTRAEILTTLIPASKLSDIERATYGSGMPFSKLVTEEQLVNAFNLHLSELNELSPALTLEKLNSLSATTTIADIIALSNGQAQTSLETLHNRGITLDPQELTIIEQYAEQFATRVGRVVGLMEFVISRAWENSQDQVIVHSVNSLIAKWEVAATRAAEQFHAQLLRSGKLGSLTFKN